MSNRRTRRTQRFSRKPQATPRLRLSRLEKLEDRSMMAITTTFSAGVLTFIGDGANDKVVLQGTATAGTVTYDDGNGLGSTTQAGVTQVLFNGNGGDDSMIISNPDPNFFVPTGGITFNGGGNNDVLTMAGGNASWSGSYTSTGASSGTISYNTGAPGILNVNFTGLQTVNDTTIAGTFTTNTNNSGSSENVTVKVGPTLTPVSSFVQGPVFVDGGDRDDHGHFNAGENHEGWLFMQEALSFVYNSKVTNFGGVSGAGTKNVLAIGVTGSTARTAFESAASLAKPGGLTFDYVTGAAISTVDFTKYDLIYVPSNSSNTSGGISAADENLLAARATGTNSIQNYVRAGGGIVALTDAATGASGGPYSWLKIPDPFSILSVGPGGISLAVTKTPEAIAAGFSITDAELSLGVPYHNAFTGPVGFNGLDVFVKDSANNFITLGQGSINETIGGGVTTQISGSSITTINIGKKTNLVLNTLSGDDIVSVDGTVNSIDGLIAPLAINGGTGTNVVAISDSADTSGDTVTINASATTGLAGANNITYSNLSALSVTTTGGDDVLTIDFTSGGLTSASVYGGLGNDTFGSVANKVQPSVGTIIFLDGGSPVSPGANPLSGNSTTGDLPGGDKLFLDMSAATAPVIVDTVTGICDSGSHKRLTYNGMEDVDQYDNGQLTNTHQGALYIRATEVADYLVLSGLAGGKVRVRINNSYFGDYAPTTKLVLFGRDGNDYIATSAMSPTLKLELYGNEGADSITGGPADDLIIGGEGLDRLSGGPGGADEIWGDVLKTIDPSDPMLDIMATPTSAAAIALRAGQSDHSIYTSSGSASSGATDGNDIITTAQGGGADRVYGQGGNDTVTTGAQNDEIFGGDGNDNLSGANGNDAIYGGLGNDNLAGEAGSDILSGGDGTDTLNGGLGEDVLIGGLGTDTLRGDAGRDMVVGGTVTYSGGNADAKVWGDTNDTAMLLLLNNWIAAGSPAIPFAGLTVTNDGVQDSLSGGDGPDAFFNEAVDLLIDYLATTGDIKAA
ncbi:MAG: hypothetical protein U0894_03065 [Pirellulales bacterium]